MKKIGVLGVGTMGAGIVQVLILSGYEVVIRSRKQTSIDKGLALVTRNLAKLVEKEKLSAADREAALSRISSATELPVVQDADLIIEAATEDMESKKALFAELDSLCKAETIIATNTSSLSVSEIAAVTKRSDRIIGMHFFNPVPVMKLIEVVKAYDTSEATAQAIIALAGKIGKTPVIVDEAPGFVVNRILVPMINEAVGILADGAATAADIDEAMKLGANHPMGPLALGDLIGLDICLAVMEVLQAEFGEDKYRPHPLLRKMVRAGKLGRKTGLGFFDYAAK
jgi:3-hydroxybutyryl-CoA dehydrogenase